MPGSYYYRPIDPGYGALGAGLAAGVDQGASAYFRERELGRQRADQRAQQDLLLDLEFARQGGARGEIPMQPTTSATGARGPALALMPRDEAAGGIPGESGMFQAPGVRMPEVVTSTPRQAPGFIAVGSGRTRGYVRDPMIAEQEKYDIGVGRGLDEAKTARETAQGVAKDAAVRVSPALTLLAKYQGHPEAPGFKEAAATLLEYGQDPTRFFKHDALTEEDPGYWDNYERKLRLERNYSTARTPTDRGLPTVSQALEIVKARYSEYGADESGKPVWKSFSKTMDEMWAEAQAMARGQEVARPDGRFDPEAMKGYSPTQIERVRRLSARDGAQGPNLLDPGTEERVPGPESPPTPEEVNAADAALPPDATLEDARRWIAAYRAGRR